MNATLDALESRLHRLADPLSASGSEPALAGVHERTRRLRRRRHFAQGVAAGVVGVVVLAGGLAAQAARDRTTTAVGPVADAGGRVGLPDVGLELAGFEELAPGAVEVPLAATPYDGGSYQVFRRPDDLHGPTIWLRHEYATDTAGALADQQPVAHGGLVQLFWNPDPAQDRSASVSAVGLSPQELSDFAAGLVPRGPGAFELDATYLPADVEEVTWAPRVPDDERTERQRTYDDGTTQVQLSIVEEPDRVYEQRIEAALQGCPWDADDCHAAVANETVEVLGRPALLTVEGAADGRWQVYWRQGTEVTVQLTVLSADRPKLNRLLNALVLWTT